MGGPDGGDTMAKIQKRGHCPHCGREQAVKAGYGMAQHGYEVEHGYFHGVCGGASHRPIEEDAGRDEALQQIEWLNMRAEQIHAECFVAPKIVGNGYSRDSRWYKEAEWDSLSERSKGEYQLNWQNERNARARAHRDMAKHVEQVVADYHGKPLIEIKLDKPQIVVGSKVKIWGVEAEVLAIENRRAVGVGPGINGQHIDHIQFQYKDRKVWYPKRYARLI